MLLTNARVIDGTGRPALILGPNGSGACPRARFEPGQGYLAVPLIEPCRVCPDGLAFVL